MGKYYAVNFYSFSNQYPFLSKIIKQIIFWIFAYGLLFLIIHFTALSVLQAMGRPTDISISGVLTLFLSLGALLGLALGIIDHFLKNYMFRNRSLGFNILVGGVLYFTVLTSIIFLLRYIVIEFISGTFLNQYTEHIIRMNWEYYNVIILSYTLFMTLVLSFINQMTNKFGPGLILPFLLGKFRYPAEENRLFMFLDLKDSTQLAEKLGHLRYSAFIQESFMDINQMVKKYNAQIYQYVGDEIVVSWPLRCFDSSLAIEFFYAVHKRFQHKKEHYLRAYDHVPIFKAGAHQGLVTAVEVGDIKREIAYHGDTLNVASRIEGLCKTYDKLILISGKVNENPKIAENFIVKPLGPQKLEGREVSVDVFCVAEK
ncbi:adenylate/guanylate cyclase domain-containing protein [Zunongwangia sp. SCSIO 43204]|uniref:adenylate/guanylate cyclase domain-containing protein n=1 Tax=Zunongwangia sp. SCSIO 43204 TaxID=2779359 RepID=UPI001CAA30B5|nr:adenylate/guanylate cyclase domain-containing protein [Zunongwangia sp. SCSIO 43204]UAB85153.1 adenylate/guanylate cyclase domain-containing protein [Zunongwangia sp. SCSIO 43204]